MAFLGRILATALVFSAVATVAAAASSGTTLRLLSFAVRDQPPTLDETQAYLAGQKSLDDFVQAWLAGAEHQTRIRRYFNDMFGVRAAIFLFDTDLGLQKDAGGVYYLQSKGDCSASSAVTTEAWWLDPGKTISLCPTSNSTIAGFTDGSGNVVSCLDIGNGLPNAVCGCGPKAILCYPAELYNTILASVRQEGQERGLYAYQNGLSWLDLVGGDTFWGNRYAYYYYANEQGLLWGTTVDSGIIAQIQQVPVSGTTKAAFPSGPERAGVVTSPGFMKQYNNYRARVRGLTQKLLCQDVDATLNVDNYGTYLNPDFTAFDKSHGLKAGCAGCHYPMDNLGSTLFNYGSEGEYSYDGQPRSQIGHAFGQDATGPRALVKAYVERGPGFTACMAKTAYESFSGSGWSELAATDQASFTTLAVQGPRPLIQGVLTSAALKNARGGGGGVGGGAGANTVAFTKIQPIVATSCNGGGCHSQGAPQTNFVDNESAFRGDSDNIAARITLNGAAGTMPPPSSGKSVAPSDRDLILTYLGKK